VKYLYCNVYDNLYSNNECDIMQNSISETNSKNRKKKYYVA
jgi:hypothetical protein